MMMPAMPATGLEGHHTARLQAAPQQSEDERAREIFEELDARRDAITYETSTMEMRIIDDRDRERRREMKSYTYEEGDVSKSLTVFEAPADVRGTGLLTVGEGDEEVQRLYLPAVGQVQTVSGSQRSDRFMGSDFTFEDLGNQNPDNFEFELLEEDEEQVKLLATPTDDSQYAYIHFYIDAERLVLEKADYFNEDDERIKELTASDYENVRDDIWRPGTMVMRDLQAERRTELRWTDRVFDDPIPERYFTERQLRRGLQ
ncbi:MAG: outer membrane lipoprotein-sorting protein [Cyclonatronaceae bacterium]